MQQKDVVKQIRGIVGEENVLTDEGSLHHYGVDWTKHYKPNPMAIVFPHTIAHVQTMVKLANEAKIPLVPSGGRTGYSGGAVASHNEVVVSFSKMNKILDFNPIDRMVVCQPGVVNQELQQFASQHDLFFPINLASSGSCEIGGNISTNAGGIKVIRYGATRDWVAGLKVVTGKGDLLDCNKGLIKNATGYDLRQLFIGAEGTLGFVVEATMRLTTKPQDLNVIVLGLVELDAIMEVLHAFRQKIELTAFEFFSDKALEFVVKYKKVPLPFETHAKYYALIEYERNHEEVDDHIMHLFKYCMEQGWVVDGVMSQSGQQFNNLWHLREYISETIIQFTPCKFDLSVKGFFKNSVNC